MYKAVRLISPLLPPPLLLLLLQNMYGAKGMDLAIDKIMVVLPGRE
jgi:hypothetical protein